MSIASAAELHAAVSSAPSGSTLWLDPGSYELSSELVIDRNLTLLGTASASAISGREEFRVLSVAAGCTVVLRDLAIAMGRSDTVPPHTTPARAIPPPIARPPD